jgi:hypothetical protein
MIMMKLLIRISYKNVRCVNMAQKVHKLGLERENGYLYYIDKDGDISRTKMKRGGTKKKKTAKRQKSDPSKK